jgi:hypothetical protein
VIRTDAPKYHGTTTLFAALDVLVGKVIGRYMQRHRHQEFIRFFNAIEKTVPTKKTVHVILDNYAAHKHPKVIAWLSRHPRVTLYFTPTGTSWLNAVGVLVHFTCLGNRSAESITSDVDKGRPARLVPAQV